jgi:hypothetical protein
MLCDGKTIKAEMLTDLFIRPFQLTQVSDPTSHTG